MYWFWFFLFAAQPGLLLLGLSGFLGEDAKKAAEDLATGMGIVFLVLVVLGIVGFLIYSILKAIGVVI